MDDRALLKGHIVPLELLNQVDVILVPSQPDIHLAKLRYRPAWRGQTALVSWDFLGVVIAHGAATLSIPRAEA